MTECLGRWGTFLSLDSYSALFVEVTIAMGTAKKQREKDGDRLDMDSSNGTKTPGPKSWHSVHEKMVEEFT